MAHAKAVLEIDARLIGEGHPRLEEDLGVEFVEVWGLVRCGLVD